MSKLRLPILAIISLLLVAACAPIRQGVSWADVNVIDGNILVAYRDYMVLVDPANGRLVPLRNAEGEIRTNDEGNPRLWEVRGSDTGSQFFTKPIWLNDDTLLAADYNSRLVVVNYDRADIQPGGEIPIEGRVIADPVVVNDEILLLGFTEKDLVAHDMETYDLLWRFETERGIWASPLVVDDTIYVPSMDHSLYAINLDGTARWQLDVGGALGSTPLLHEDRLFVGTFGRRLLEISLNGEIVTEYSTEDWIWSSPVLYEDGLLYVSDMGGYVYALDPNNDLSEVWKSKAASGGIRPSPLVTEQYVIVGDRDGKVYWLDRETGEVTKTQEVGGEILSELILVERAEPLEPLVVVSTVENDKVLVAFTLEADANWTYGR